MYPKQQGDNVNVKKVKIAKEKTTEIKKSRQQPAT
jgi:hypothetical protein